MRVNKVEDVENQLAQIKNQIDKSSLDKEVKLLRA